MIPCTGCRRHIRERDLECPFCRAPLRSSAGAASLFAVALAGVFALTSCSSDSGSDDEAGTTTSQGSSSDDATTSDATTSDATQTSTDTDSDDSTDDWGNSAGSFYAGPDYDLPTSPTSCDPWAQDCPEGEKCAPYASSGGTWDANKCVPVLGDGMPGAACTLGSLFDGMDDCNGTSACQQIQLVDDQLVGICTAFCTGDPDQPICGEGESCLIANDGSLTLCLSSCDPLAQACPIAGTACVDLPVDPPEFACWLLAEQAATGESCDMGLLAGCAPGNDCVPGPSLPDCQGDSCCASFCPLDGMDPCEPAGTACTAFFAPGRAPAGYENVGLCVVP